MSVKLSDLTTESAPASTDILLIADPTTGLAKKITVSALKTYMDGLGGGGDATAPVVVSATATAGSTVVIVFSESVTVTTAGWSFKLNGAAWAISSVTGSGNTWTFTMATSATSSDTILRSYSSTTGSTVDTAANELATFTDSAVTNSIPSNQLATPGSFSATVASSSQINLTWTDVANESSYRIDRSTDNSNWTQIGGTIAAGTTSYNATGLNPSTLYYFRIKAVGDGVTYTDSGYATDSDTTSSSFLTSSSTGSEMESYNTSKGWRKKSTSSDAWGSPSTAACQVVFNETLASGEEVICKVGSDPTKAIYLILSNGGSPDAANNTDIDYALYSGEGLASNVRAVENGALAGSAQAISAGDLIKLKYAGSTITYERSTNGGSSWSTFFTGVTSASGSYAIRVQAYSISAGFDEIYKA